jgi:hypothetical protein
MKRKVQVYIEGNRLELFEDEQIQVNSSIQNIQDISKVFTDFSQSFSVPCSQHNNPIFEHFYENSLNGTINPNLRRDAFIEIDLTFFRGGKMQLESVQLKNGQPYAYKVTFYGEIRSLKDRFGEDKLVNLDWTPYSHYYDASEVQMRVTDATDYDVRYPLISSRRVWQYNEPSTPNDNIDSALGAIEYTELFPALKNKEILRTIGVAYGVGFTGLFLNDPRFVNSFLHLKNKETFTNLSEIQSPDFVNKFVINNGSAQNYQYMFDSLDLTTDVLHIQQIDPNYVTEDHTVSLLVTSASNNTPYTIQVFQNGQLTNTINNFGTSNNLILSTSASNGLDSELTFQIYTQAPVDLTFQLSYGVVYWYYDSFGNLFNTWNILTANTNTQTFTNNLNVGANMPDLKVADYFSGLLKEFNLTCYPIDANTFQIEPLEDWYSKGTIYDITQYTDLEEINISRVPLYKKIEFKHEQSASFMNRKFFQFNGREYGDLSNSYPYDGQEYIVNVPFEQPLFNNFTNTNVQVGYYLGEEPTFQPYVPKPVILYFDKIQDCFLYFSDGTTPTIINTYAVFGQDTTYNNVQWSLNFGQEVSSFYLETIPRSLYDVYYRPYLQNMFNVQNRLTEVKTVLPLRILTNLKLNDRLIIRDKRYVINEMKSNLTSGEVGFTLLHDFRPLRKKKVIRIKPTVTTHKEPILFPNGVVQADIDVTGTSITADVYTMTAETEVTFTIPVNPYPVEEIVSEDGVEILISEDNSDVIVAEPYTINIETVSVIYTYNNGSTEVEPITFEF